MNRKVIAAAIMVAVISIVSIFLVAIYVNRPPPPPPMLTLTFDKSRSAPPNLIIMGETDIEYDFNVTVTVLTSMNFPLGENVNSSVLNHALKPLLGKYNLLALNHTDNDAQQ
jgi:hypothetical protein